MKFKSVIEVDDFVARLWKICETVNREGISQVETNRINLFYSSLLRNCFSLISPSL